MKKIKSDHCGGCGVKFTEFAYWPRWTREMVDTGLCWRFVCQRCSDERVDDDNTHDTQGAQT